MSMQQTGLQIPYRPVGYEHARAKRRAHRVLLAPASEVYEVSARITHIDRAIIRSYFYDHADSLPDERRGQSRQPTAPMWLSSDVFHHALPVELERKLSALPAGYARVLVGRNVLLIEPASRRVVDILHQVAQPNS